MTRKECIHLVAAFRVEQRAGDIDQPAAGPHEFSRDIEQPRLSLDETLQPLGRQPPPPFRITAPGAGARTWRVDQHRIAAIGERGQHFEFAPRVDQARFDDPGARPRGS